MKRIPMATRGRWRLWLERNHDKENGVWLVFHRKESGRPSIRYDEALDEALCYGWIDSVIKKIDEESYARKFSPRKAKSKWSPSNKARVAALTKDGLMTEAGLEVVKAAKANGSWDRPERPDFGSLESPELEEALRKNAVARKAFFALAPSYRRQYVVWVAMAKRTDTRRARLEEAIGLLKKGEKLGIR